MTTFDKFGPLLAVLLLSGAAIGTVWIIGDIHDRVKRIENLLKDYLDREGEE